MFQGHYLGTVPQDEAAAEEEAKQRPCQGLRRFSPRRVFVENTLQGPPMHFEAPGGLGDIASALLKHPLDVFPAHPVCRHGILGWSGQWPLRFQQGSGDIVCVGGFWQVIDSPLLNCGNRRRNITVAGQHHDPAIWLCFLDSLNDLESVAIIQPQIDYGVLANSPSQLDALGHAFSRGNREPRGSMARQSRIRNEASSSTISRLRSPGHTFASLINGNTSFTDHNRHQIPNATSEKAVAMRWQPHPLDDYGIVNWRLNARAGSGR